MATSTTATEQQLRTEAHRRQLRQSYFTLIQDTHDHRGDLIEPGTDHLNTYFHKGNQLLQDVTHAREGSLDTHWFKLTSQYSVEQARKIDINSRTKPEEFIARLKHHYIRKPGAASAMTSTSNQAANTTGAAATGGRRTSTRQDKGKGRATDATNTAAALNNDEDNGEEATTAAASSSSSSSPSQRQIQMSDLDDEDGELVLRYFDWKGLGRDVSRHFRRAPSITFMFGPLKLQPKHRTIGPRKRAARLDDQEAEHPEEVASQQKSMNETSKHVESIRKRLKKEENRSPEKCASFLDLVAGPNSFGKTVENIFYFSFLIKDGHASLKCNTDGRVVATTAEPPSSEQYKSDTGEKKQAVLRFDLNLFEQLKKHLGSQKGSSSAQVADPTTTQQNQP